MFMLEKSQPCRIFVYIYKQTTLTYITSKTNTRHIGQQRSYVRVSNTVQHRNSLELSKKDRRRFVSGDNPKLINIINYNDLNIKKINLLWVIKCTFKFII